MIDKVCEVIENGKKCGRPYHSKGMCNMHRQRFLNHGFTHKPKRRPLSPEGRKSRSEAAVRRRGEMLDEFTWLVNGGDPIHLALEKVKYRGSARTMRKLFITDGRQPPRALDNEVAWLAEVESERQRLDQGSRWMKVNETEVTE